MPRWHGTVGFRDARLVADAGAPDGALRYSARGRRPARAAGRLELGAGRRPVRCGDAASGSRTWSTWPPARAPRCCGCGAAGWWRPTSSTTRATGPGCWSGRSSRSPAPGCRARPATDDAFVEHLRRRGRRRVSSRRARTIRSLLAWGGGNELDLDGVPLDDAALTRAGRAARGRRPRSTPAGRGCRRRRPGRCSHIPAGRDRRCDRTASTTSTAPGSTRACARTTRCTTRGTALAHTEFGVEGMTNPRGRSAAWSPRGPMAGRPQQPGLPAPGRLVGQRAVRPAELRRAAADVECAAAARAGCCRPTGLAYAVEADRRRWPRCSMVLPWQLTESYPNAWCTSAVDHSRRPEARLPRGRRARSRRSG